MRKSGLNSAYSKTEKRILAAFAKILKDNHLITVKTQDISKEAGIATSSFYIHYHSLSDLMIKNEAMITDGLKKLVYAEMRSNTSNERRLNNVLLFLYRHKEFLDITVLSKNVDFSLNIVSCIKPIAEYGWPKYSESIQIGLESIISAEYVAEINLWRKEHYSIDKISMHAHHMAYFTITAPKFYAALFNATA